MLLIAVSMVVVFVQILEHVKKIRGQGGENTECTQQEIYKSNIILFLFKRPFKIEIFLICARYVGLKIRFESINKLRDV